MRVRCEDAGRYVIDGPAVEQVRRVRAVPRGAARVELGYDPMRHLVGQLIRAGCAVEGW